VGYDESLEGDFMMSSSEVFKLKLLGKIRMRREVAKAVHAARDGKAVVVLELRRPLDYKDFYESVVITDGDYETVTADLSKWFTPKGLSSSSSKR